MLSTIFIFISCQVYIPLLTVHQMNATCGGYQSEHVSPHEAVTDEESSVKLSEQFTVRDELLNMTYKFLGLINTTIQQLKIQGLL